VPIEPLLVASHFSDPDNDALTYVATGLPGGSGFSLTNGRLEGQASLVDVQTASPSISLSITARDASGGSVAAPLRLTVVENGAIVAQTQPMPVLHTTQNVNVFFDVSPYFVATGFNEFRFATDALPASTGLVMTAAGVILGAPSSGDERASRLGGLVVSVLALDADGVSVSNTLMIAVTNAPDAPVIATELLDVVATQKDVFAPVYVQNAFSDPDGDALTFVVFGLPVDTGISLVNGVLSGVPTNADSLATIAAVAGGSARGFPLTLSAIDPSGLVASQTMHFFCFDQNDSPTVVQGVATPVNLWYEQGDTLYVDVAPFFVDVDYGETLTYSVTRVDAYRGASMSTLSLSAPTGGAPRIFSGVLNNGDAMASPLQFLLVATDTGGATAFTNLNVYVVNKNDSPEPRTRSPAPLTVTQGVLLSSINSPLIQLGDLFFDVDGDALVIEVANISPSSGVQYDATTMSLFGTPTNADVITSPLILSVVATDLSGAQASVYLPGR
jgi:hypothetical protein